MQLHIPKTRSQTTFNRGFQSSHLWFLKGSGVYVQICLREGVRDIFPAGDRLTVCLHCLVSELDGKRKRIPEKKEIRHLSCCQNLRCFPLKGCTVSLFKGLSQRIVRQADPDSAKGRTHDIHTQSWERKSPPACLVSAVTCASMEEKASPEIMVILLRDKGDQLLPEFISSSV